MSEEGTVVFSHSEARALLELAAGGDAAGRIADADLIDQLAAALVVCLISAREPEGVDPMAWRQANAALFAAGRSPIDAPPNHAATWLRRRGERGLGPF